MHVFPDRSVYIGVTKQKNLNLRWGYSGEGYDNQENVRKQIDFWGWGLVKHVILEQGDMTKEEAYKKECDYTLKYAKEGYKVLNKYNANDPCRYRVKKTEREYEYVDITTGKVYNSLRDAARDIGVTHETIRMSIIKGRAIKKGNKFEKRLKEIIIILEEDKE